ncbi:hypothetical protein VTK56DRAFT_8398 [Thermocarpiscus australiensis]
MDMTTLNQQIPTVMAGVDPHESISEEDDEEYDCDPEITLRSIDKSKTINFSIRANYTDWAPREAFRELVQNWRDANIRTYNLAERDFCVIREEKQSGCNTEIVYKLRAQTRTRSSSCTR